MYLINFFFHTICFAQLNKGSYVHWQAVGMKWVLHHNPEIKTNKRWFLPFSKSKYLDIICSRTINVLCMHLHRRKRVAHFKVTVVIMSLCQRDDNIQVVLETVDYIWDDHLTRFVILERGNSSSTSTSKRLKYSIAHLRMFFFKQKHTNSKLNKVEYMTSMLKTVSLDLRISE